MFIVRDNSFENEKPSLFRNTVSRSPFRLFQDVTSRLNVLNLNILINLRSISNYEITNFQPQNEINNHSAQPHNFQFQNNSKPDPLKRSQNLPSYKSRILNVGEPNSPENNAPHPSQQENLHSSHFTWL